MRGRLHSGFIAIGALVVGRWMLLPFRRSDELLVFQDADGGIDVGVARPKERRDRLRAKVFFFFSRLFPQRLCRN